MNIYNLMSFIEIIEENSISKAAKKLHLTQSALSQQLKSIEKVLDCKLLVRSNKGVIPTEEGKIVFKYAGIFSSLYNNMIEEIEECHSDEIKEIRIVSSGSVCEYLIPCTLYTYKEKNKDIKFSTKSDYTKNVVDLILSRGADVGFVTVPIYEKGIECIKLYKSDLVFIYSPKNKDILISENISLKEVASLPFIIGPEESGIRKTIEDIFHKNSISFNNVNVHMELGSIESIKTSVMENHGVSIVPYISVKKELYTGTLKSRTIEEADVECHICMIYQKEQLQEEYIKGFINYMKKFGRDTFC